MNDFIGR